MKIIKLIKFTTSISFLILISFIIFYTVKGLNMSSEFTGGYEYTIPNNEIIECDSCLISKHENFSTITSKEPLLIDENKILGEKYISPKIGDEIKNNAIYSISICLIMIFFYISIKYNILYSIGATYAIINDIIITIFITQALNIEINMGTISALLAIAGYSLNDTVVTYDKFKKVTNDLKINKIDKTINIGIKKILKRTLITSLTTLSSLLFLIIFSTNELYSFAVTIFIGIAFGTISSLLIAPYFIIYSKNKNLIKSKNELSLEEKEEGVL